MSISELPRRAASDTMIGFSPLASVDQGTLDAIPTAIVVFGPSGQILRINRNALDLLFYPALPFDRAAPPLFLGNEPGTNVVVSAIIEGLPI